MFLACRCIFSRAKRRATLQTPNRGLQARLSNPRADAVLRALEGLNALSQQAPRRFQRLWCIHIVDATGIVHRQR